MLTTSSEYYCEPLVNSVYVTVATIIYLQFFNMAKRSATFICGLRCYDPHVDKCVMVHEACVLHSRDML